ncbi:PRC-barrel domain-containing protein [Desulforudis sp. 1088]|uniref:PRC-barrel domain-containing protein n=1 Tax=unclassified Candidatus Desulforudis TaxID=2635950 RepID=UPI003469FCAE
MRRSREIVGLPVISINEAAEVGQVKGLLVNPATGSAEFIVINRDGGFRECLVVRFKDIESIGPDVLTVARAEVPVTLSSVPEALKVLDQQVGLIGTPVMTRKGKIAGVIREFAVDEESGLITGLEIALPGQDKAAGVIPTINVAAYGRKFVVINNDLPAALVPGFDHLEPASQNGQPAEAKAAEAADPLKYFEEQQKQYLLGRTVTKQIVADDGTVVAEAGEVVTKEVIDRAIQHNKYIELTLNTGA